MKKLLKTMSAAALMTILLLAAGCSGLVNEPGAVAGKDGTVAIQVGSGASARTLAPEVGNFEKYEVVITNAAAQNGKKDGDVEAEPELDADGAANVSLKPGAYIITVKGILKTDVVTEGDTEAEIAGLPVASGSASVTVTPGAVTPANIVLKPVSAGVPQGTFAYSVRFPLEEVFGGYNTTSIEIISAYNGDLLDPDLVKTVTDEDDNPLYLETADTVLLDPGVYTLTVTIKTDKQSGVGSNMGIVITDTVYIYSTLTTAYEQTFTEEDIAATFHFEGTVTVNDLRTAANTYRPVKVYGLIEDDGIPLADAQAKAWKDIPAEDWDAVSKSAKWSMDLPAYYLKLDSNYIPEFYFELASDDAAPLSLKDVGHTRVPTVTNKGKTGITTAINLYGIDFTQPAHGTITFENGNAYAWSGTNNDRLYFTAAPDTGYAFDEYQIRLNADLVNLYHEAGDDADRYYVAYQQPHPITGVDATFFTFSGVAVVDGVVEYEPKKVEVWGYTADDLATVEDESGYHTLLAATETDAAFTAGEWTAKPTRANAYVDANSRNVTVKLTIGQAGGPDLVYSVRKSLTGSPYELIPQVIDLEADGSRAYGKITAVPRYVLFGDSEGGYPVPVTFTHTPDEAYGAYGTLLASPGSLIAGDPGVYTWEYSAGTSVTFSGDEYFTFKGAAWTTNLSGDPAVAQAKYRPTQVSLVAEGDETVSLGLGSPSAENNWAISVPEVWKYYTGDLPRAKFDVTWTSGTAVSTEKGPTLHTVSAAFDPQALPPSIQLNAEFYPITFTNVPASDHYTVTLLAPNAVASGKAYGIAGSTVQFSVTPAAGYFTSRFAYAGISGSGANYVADSDTGSRLTYEFTMPTTAITSIGGNVYQFTGSVELTGTGATGYTIDSVKVKNSNTGADLGALTLTGSAYSKTFTNLEAISGKTYDAYYFTFEVTYRQNSDSATNTVSRDLSFWSLYMQVDLTAPTADLPYINTASARSSSVIEVQAGNSYYHSGWNIYRVEGSYERKLNDTPIPSSQDWYIDTGLTPATSYTYKVTAVNDLGKESDKSAGTTGWTQAVSAAVANLQVSPTWAPNAVPSGANLYWASHSATKVITKYVDGGIGTVVAAEASSSSAGSFDVYQDWAKGAKSITYKVQPVTTTSEIWDTSTGSYYYESHGYHVSYSGTAYLPNGPATTVTLDLPELTELASGVPGTGSVAAGQYAFYKVDLSAYSSISQYYLKLAAGAGQDASVIWYRRRIESSDAGGSYGDYSAKSTPTYLASNTSYYNQAILRVGSAAGANFTLGLGPVITTGLTRGGLTDASLTAGEYRYYTVSADSINYLRLASGHNHIQVRLFPGEGYLNDSYLVNAWPTVGGSSVKTITADGEYWFNDNYTASWTYVLEVYAAEADEVELGVFNSPQL
jgi:hypothetical protein